MRNDALAAKASIMASGYRAGRKDLASAALDRAKWTQLSWAIIRPDVCPATADQKVRQAATPCLAAIWNAQTVVIFTMAAPR